MSVLIKGIGMPKEDTILIVLSPNGAAYIEAEEEPFPYKTTAIELPPHGRMIDIDALIDYFLEWYDPDAKLTVYEVLDHVRAEGDCVVPVIIPAEKGY